MHSIPSHGNHSRAQRYPYFPLCCDSLLHDPSLPCGCLSSMTFGLPGEGVGIETETLEIEPAGDLVVAVSRGAGKSVLLPYLSGATSEDYEGKMAAKGAVTSFRNWSMIRASQMSRRLTPAFDEFHGGDLTLRVTSPHFPMKEAPVVGKPAPALLPALLVEVELGNAASDQINTATSKQIGVTYYPRLVTLGVLIPPSKI